MAIASFFTPDLTTLSTELSLSDNEASHAIKSRRLKLGQAVRIFNGLGLIAMANISSIDRRKVILTVQNVVQHAAVKKTLTMAVAVPKGDRQKVMVDMLTQIGVTTIQPVHYQYSVSAFNEKLKLKWQRWAIEACKQSQNPWLPIINDQCDLMQLMNNSHELIYVDIQGQRLDSVIVNAQARDVLALIGPEGGFAEHEIELFKRNKLTTVRLTEHILRTETAAVSFASQWRQFDESLVI